MKKIKIITDSTAYLEEKDIERLDVKVVPLSFTIDGQNYVEGLPGSYEESFLRLKKSKDSLKTSQPAVGDFLEAYEEIFSQGYNEIIGVILSSKLSGSYNSAKLAKDLLEDKMITIIDSNNTAGNIKYIIEDIRSLLNDGKSTQEIEDIIGRKIENSKILLTVENLDYLSKGGRISSLSSKLGNVFNIKPILQLEEGQIGLVEKTRGKKQALNKIISMIDDSFNRIGVYHVNSKDEAEKILEQIKKDHPDKLVSIGELGPVVGAHLGPGGIGICMY